ncbi:methylated-DNA--[protein]-cysteine S-methyltransferase [Mahella australiensis]|uniref:Methylated-DNA--protein-cysteine methyltransferase n=1 Tax=Mahella australiensis (strain DSM 15567 / CIP 107919 / 50-1 BON) TaxID=697281 RepID=F3ZYB3_MAHA5|nr:methylated-DNA--[protein]-cysteine S-methyltransferase [Mahella australiensis]AEE95638.1 methylated-DNA/protein-cysteinemethyltransferase [Mahella australiensis 50-1 BON]
MIETKNIFFYETDIGRIIIADNGDAIVAVSFGDTNMASHGDLNETPLIEEAARQIYQYLKKERCSFALPLSPKGTIFQQKVWAALQTIPYGETRSYKQVAEAIGQPKAFRAVGMACNKNPIAIIIPCHRVIGSNGSLTGYAGGVELKARLLQLERS